MSLRRFRATALTPIHIGCGQTITPEDYLIEGDRVIRFNPHSVIRDLHPAQRQRYERLLESNNLPEALRLLRERAKDPKHRLYEARIGAGARRDLAYVVENPNRRGEVHLLPRNLQTGEVIIPGSAIKGAIRTALLNAFAHEGTEIRPDVAQAVNEARQTDKRVASVLEETAFGYRRNKTESDPMRLVKVSDAAVPAGAVRVDRVSLHNREGGEDQRQKIQMHFERLVSCADGEAPMTFQLEISLLDQVAAHPTAGRLFAADLTWDFLMSSCTYFFANRLRAEVEHFQELNDGIATWMPDWNKPGGLLRVGRFCHFESLSVDDLREGFNIRTKQPIVGMGSSRTLCELANGRRAPFGWLWLEPV